MASRALIATLSTTCSRLLRSARLGDGGCGWLQVEHHLVAHRRSIGARALTTSFRSKVAGCRICWRENAATAP
jgi:hypothetical protein